MIFRLGAHERRINLNQTPGLKPSERGNLTPFDRLVYQLNQILAEQKDALRGSLVLSRSDVLTLRGEREVQALTARANERDPNFQPGVRESGLPATIHGFVLTLEQPETAPALA